MYFSPMTQHNKIYNDNKKLGCDLMNIKCDVIFGFLVLTEFGISVLPRDHMAYNKKNSDILANTEEKSC